MIVDSIDRTGCTYTQEYNKNCAATSYHAGSSVTSVFYYTASAFGDLDMYDIRSLYRDILIRWWHWFTRVQRVLCKSIQTKYQAPSIRSYWRRLLPCRSGWKGRTVLKRIGKFYKDGKEE